MIRFDGAGRAGGWSGLVVCMVGVTSFAGGGSDVRVDCQSSMGFSVCVRV